jgi:tetratricopeptide (TPR) repeat protein
MGGNPELAAQYARTLENIDKIWAAKARELILDKSKSRVNFWQNELKKNPGNAEVLEQLAKAYLYQDNTSEALKHLNQAIEADPTKYYLYLDLARYYLMSSRQDKDNAKNLLINAEASLNSFLETESIIPIRAFAYNMLSRAKRGMGAAEEASKLHDKAHSLDPNVSKAFGVPPALLFEKPETISTYHSYFSRPF